MHKPFSILALFFALSVSACAPRSYPTATLPTVASPIFTPSPQRDSPRPSPTPVATATLEGLLPPTLPLKVGATYMYVDGSVLVAVPAGEFLMGHGGADNPEHTVYLNDFWIYRAPVTNRQYAVCVAAGRCAPPASKDNPAYASPYRASDPVVGVTWEQAVSYCRFVHGRLPTEAEWEKVARGPDGHLYPWGEAAPSCHLANLSDCVGTTSDVTTHPLGKSYYGALDMAGNTFEWVADWYSPVYYSESPYENPFGPEVGQKRSVRSSGFSAPFYAAESARRSFADPLTHRPDLGFRCVVEDPTHYAPFCERASLLQSIGVVSETCPDLSISQAQYCGLGNVPLANVTFSGPSEASIDPGSCTLLAGRTYLCDEPTTVQICAVCTLNGVLEATCPPGYHLTGNLCHPDLTFSGECLPGFAYDSVDRCCREKGELLLEDLSYTCPDGTYYADPPGACVPVPAMGTTCVSLTVTLKTCGLPECTPPPTCPPNSSWNSRRCCCYDPVINACR